MGEAAEERSGGSSDGSGSEAEVVASGSPVAAAPSQASPSLEAGELGHRMLRGMRRLASEGRNALKIRLGEDGGTQKAPRSSSSGSSASPRSPQALAARGVELPCPDVLPLDNVHRCFTVMFMTREQREAYRQRAAHKAAEQARACAHCWWLACLLASLLTILSIAREAARRGAAAQAEAA